MKIIDHIEPELYPHPPIIGWCRGAGGIIRFLHHSFYGLCAAGAEPSDYFARLPDSFPGPLGFHWLDGPTHDWLLDFPPMEWVKRQYTYQDLLPGRLP